MDDQDQADRIKAIHLLRSGQTPQAVAQELKRSLAWTYKWRARYRQDGWAGVKAQSRAPKRQRPRLPERVLSAIRTARSELEAEAEQPGKLTYIGAHAVQARLRQQRLRPLPSISSIERELRRAGMTRPRQPPVPPETCYPQLTPQRPGQLIQADIQPHYLPGGGCVSCFNALDVVSRYPTGQQYLSKRSQDACDFLLQVWRELGVADYTQLDNESCFSGGFTHPHVLGKVVRLALFVGTQLVFSPFYHPKSNGQVERFHQDYSRHVWQAYELPDLTAVRRYSPGFFQIYRASRHHSALQGRSPLECHARRHPLPTELRLPQRWPLTAGQVHFMRQVDEQGCIRVLNVDWPVPAAQPGDGVWATLKLTTAGAKLRIYDAAPDAPARRRLARHPFPLKEPVVPLQAQFRRAPARRLLPWRRTAQAIFGWISTMF